VRVFFDPRYFLTHCGRLNLGLLTNGDILQFQERNKYWYRFRTKQTWLILATVFRAWG